MGSNHKKKHRFEILKSNFDHGMKGSVTLVKRESDGELFVLKTPIKDNYAHHRSLRSEIRKARLWRELGISEIDVYWYQDKISLLKSYVKGKTLAEIEKDDPMFFSRIEDHAVVKLGKMLKHVIHKKYYVGDLSTGNLIFDGKKWQVVDSGSVHKRNSKSSIAKEYKEKLLGKWSRELNQDGIIHLRSFLEKYCD